MATSDEIACDVMIESFSLSADEPFRTSSGITSGMDHAVDYNPFFKITQIAPGYSGISMRSAGRQWVYHLEIFLSDD